MAGDRAIIMMRLLLSTIFLSYSGVAAAAAAESPNFILILTDDQGWTSTSASMDPQLDASSDYYRTPNIERLAESGMRFAQGYAPAALCCPTRRSLQFGQTPVRQGDDDQFAARYPTQNSRPTIPRLLKSVNPKYAAAHYGKWDLRRAADRGNTPLGPEHLGYDEGDGNTDNGEGSMGDNGAPDPIAKKGKWTEHALLEDPKRIFGMTERANEFITRMTKADRPFYVQLSHYAVHADFQCRESTYTAAKERSPGSIHQNPAFAAMTADLDAGIGRLLDRLDELQIADNTYVIYMADNGGVPWIPPDKAKHFANPTTLNDKGQNYPLRGGKWNLFEGGVRVPFIVRGPGIAPGSVSRVPVAGWDILPTIADLAGCQGDLPDDLDGGSFRSVLQNNGEGTVDRLNEFLVFHRFSKGYAHSAIRQGDYKLIRFWDTQLPVPVDQVYLFNLATDHGETTNLAAEMPNKARELEDKLITYLRDVDSGVVR